MLPILAALAANGLSLLGNAVLKKGQEVVEKQLGISLKPDPTPEDLRAYRQAEIDHKEFLLNVELKHSELELDLTKQEIADRGSARFLQEAALAQTDIFAKRFIYYYTWFWSIFSGSYLAGVTFLVIPESNQRVVDTILGFLMGTLIASLIGFFYGAQHRVEKHLVAAK